MGKITKMGSLCLLGIVLLADTLVAGTITAEIDKTVGSVEDTFYYTLTITGDPDGEPQIPDIDGVEIQAAGTSSKRSWINGTYSKEIIYNYILVPLRAGEFKIPSISLEIDGRQQITAPIEFKVKPVSDQSAEVSDAPIFIKREVDKTQAYVGEQIIVRTRIYHRVKLIQANEERGSSDAFKSLRIKGEKNYNKVVNGQTYRVVEITEIFVPIKAGENELPGYSLNANIPLKQKRPRRPRQFFDGFFDEDFFGGRVVRKRAVAPTTKLKVMPLPKKGQPDDFTGLVGSFQLNADLSANEIKTGETVTLTVTLRGTGDMAGIGSLDLELDPRVKVYEDQPIQEQSLDSEKGILSKRVYKYALVPTEPGEYRFDPVKVAAFIPRLGQYVDLSVELGSLVVTGDIKSGDSLSSPQFDRSKKRNIEVLAEDLIDIHRGKRLLQGHELDRNTWFLVTMIGGGPLAMLLASFGFAVFSNARRQADEGELRRSRAYRQFRKSFPTNSEIFQSVDDAIAKINGDLRQYVGDKFQVEGKALTNEEAVDVLMRAGVNGIVVDKLREILEQINSYEYGGKQPSQADVSGLITQVREMVKGIEKQC